MKRCLQYHNTNRSGYNEETNPAGRSIASIEWLYEKSRSRSKQNNMPWYPDGHID